MYSHNMVGSNDLEASKKFYDATFQAIGGKPAIVDDKGRLIYMHNGGLFLVGAPIDGEPASVGNGCTIGFAMDGPEQANAWHDAGIAAVRSEEHTSELQSLMRISHAVFCLKKKNHIIQEIN